MLCGQSGLTRVALPIKVIFGIAVAVSLNSGLLPGGAVGERYVVIRNVVEEMNFILVQQETGSNGMDRRIAPAFVEESTVLVERIEEVDIGIGPQPVEVTDFEVRPL